MKSTRGNRLIVVGVIGSILALAGCASDTAAAPAPVTSATASETPTPTTSETTAWPAKLVATSCDELVPVAVRDAVFGRSLPARSGSSNASDARTFHTTALENAGGLACEWEEAAGTGNPEDDLAVSVQLLPRSQAAFEQISTEMGAESPSTQLPEMFCNWRACMKNELVGEYSVSVVVRGYPTPPEGGVPPSEAVALADSAMAVVGSLAPSAAPIWPSTKPDWPTSCEEFISEASLGEALTLPGATFTRGYNYEGSNIGNAAILTSGGLVCGLATQSGSRMGGISVLPESAERFAAVRGAVLDTAGVEAVQIAGLGADDAFITQRVDMPGSALLDMNLNGTWVVLNVAGSIFEAPDASAEERLIGLANALAAGH